MSALNERQKAIDRQYPVVYVVAALMGAGNVSEASQLKLSGGTGLVSIDEGLFKKPY